MLAHETVHRPQGHSNFSSLWVPCPSRQIQWNPPARLLGSEVKQKKKVLTNKHHHQHQQTMCLNKCLMTHDLTYMTQLDKLWPCLGLHLRVRYNSGHYSGVKSMHPKKLRSERSSPCYHAGQWWLECSQVRYWKHPATDTDAFPHVAKVPTRDLLLSFIPHPDIAKNIPGSAYWSKNTWRDNRNR